MDNLFLCEFLGTPPRSSPFFDFLDRVFRKTVPWLRIGSCWRGQMASIESRMNIFHLLSQVLIQGVPGDIVEIGCHAGESTVVMQRMIQELDPSRTLHAFDSFQGVPQGDSADEGVYKPGDMTASHAQFIENFDRLGLKHPVVRAGWFDQTLPNSLPNQIAFALVDADLYRSTLQALEAVYPRLSPGAICLLGVYWDPRTRVELTNDRKYKSPGVKQACDEFLADTPERVSILLAGNYTSGYFRKKAADTAIQNLYESLLSQ
jgi:O-methyltransferase